MVPMEKVDLPRFSLVQLSSAAENGMSKEAELKQSDALILSKMIEAICYISSLKF